MEELCKSPIAPINPFYHYCITRQDLPFGVKCAQLIHAAGESSPGNLPPHTHAIGLEARDEEALLALEAKLIEKGIPHKAIREPDAPYHNALMAIGIEPMTRDKLRPLLSRYPLIK